MYWINYNIEVLKTGEIIKQSIICDKYTFVMDNCVTEILQGRFKKTDVIKSYIIPRSAVIDIKEFAGESDKCDFYHSIKSVKEILDLGFLEGDCIVCEHYEICRDNGII